MTTKKQKLLLIIFGLAIAVFLLEISLRSAAFIYQAYRISNKKNVTGQDINTIKILCLGDSFTFGSGAERGLDYPAQLEKLLNDSYQHKKFIVYNAGIPGQNSSQVLKRLVRDINIYRPDIILLLVGSNDRSVLEDSDYYKFQKPVTSKIADFLLRTDTALSKLRSYKLMRIAVLNLERKIKPKAGASNILAGENNAKNKEFPKEEQNGEWSYLGLAEQLYNKNKFEAAEKIIKEKPGGLDPRDKKECLFLGNIYCEQERYDLAFAVIEDHVKNSLDDPSVLFTLGRIYYMRGKNDSESREEDFRQADRLFKESLSYIDSNDLSFRGEVYSYLAKLYFDKQENKLATEMAENALKCQPENKIFQQFIRVISESSLTSEENEIFDKLLYYNLGNVINLCRLNNIKLILLNYPKEYNGDIRKRVSEKYNISFVNIGAEFSNLLYNKYKYKDLFSIDRNHPNANGYRVISEAVFRRLQHEIWSLERICAAAPDSDNL